MALEFKNISHNYSSRQHVGAQLVDTKEADLGWSMKDVSLRLERGEIISLFGPSGCGKTTLLRLAAGLETLQQGEILLDGHVLAKAHQGSLSENIPPEKRPIGFVFQDYVLFPHLTVLENIKFGLAHLSSKAQNEEAHIHLESLRLQGLEKRYPHELSGGQQQRVALARALARKPAALLLDEPFASIGADLRRTLQEEMRLVLKRHNVAAIFITHDSQEALLMGDRIALMKEGRLFDDNTPDRFYHQPQTKEASLLFAGHQRVPGIYQEGLYQEGADQEGMIKTPFGSCIIGHDKTLKIAGYKEGSFANNTPLEIVVDENAFQLDVDQDNDNHEGTDLLVRDCRFVGPDYLGIVHHQKNDVSIRIRIKNPVTIGERVRCSFNPEKIKFIADGE